MQAFLESLGGMGLFLYGMAAMTSGLRKLAGDHLRQWLARSTATPFTGVLTGAATTALVQSSSATTVATVGFVGAGLLTFTQALGIIFGANIGTTITGWMVAVIGFKLKLATAALPIVFVASILYLFKPYRRLRALGKTLAGFGLIFIGISFLQEGLAEYRQVIDLSNWKAEHLGGRLMLLVAGGLLTLITQSSSATVAAALTALSTSILTLPQTAAVIIGADIGTTVTAALATVGGTTASRRTGFAHVIYNVITGLTAFLILPAYLWGAEIIAPEALRHSPEMVAVGFHSFFNFFGVLLVLPFTRSFARFIITLISDRAPGLTASFDKAFLKDPHGAVDNLEAGTRRLAIVAIKRVLHRLTSTGERTNNRSPEPILDAIDQGRTFALHIGQDLDNAENTMDRIFAALHMLDHIERLTERTKSESDRGSTACRVIWCQSQRDSTPSCTRSPKS